MAPSANRVAGAVAAAVALAGCVSTQTKNARTVLVNERTLSSESPVRVARINLDVQVTALQKVSSAHGGALVVAVHNRTDHPVSDLPISAGVIVHGRARYLNAAANLPYFETHIPSIESYATTIWVLTTRRAIPAGTLFARVGFAREPGTTDVPALPRIRVLGAPAGPHLRATVVNSSGVPQYGLQVYAVGLRAGRYVVAGHSSLATLEGGASAHLVLPLLGAPAGARFELVAPATIFK